jgi:dipeptidyl aminopeptidase/acylaminoacyl peptidase
MSGQLINLHWSPDSRKVCFTRSEPAGDSLWEVNRDGWGLVCLFPGKLSKQRSNSGFWTPNGKYLIAQGVCEGTRMPTAVRLGSMPFNWFAAGPTCLGLGPETIAVTTASPDGKRLFGLGGTATRPLLEEYDARTRRFQPFRGGLSAEYADFSKDGQRLAWVVGANDLTDASSLFVSDIDGSHKVQLTKPPLRAELPRWSPDGKWISFMGKDEGQKWRARVVSAEGGPYEPVSPQDNQEGAPTWSPDGTRIAFGGMVQPSIRTTGRLVIHILNLQTGQMSEVPGSEDLWTARWSPDGRYLAAMTADVHNLMLFDFHTARWTKLADMASILEITWARRQEALYFNAEPTPGERGLFRVKIPGGEVERIADLKGSSDSDWFGLAPDDTPLVVRNRTPKEVYGITVKWP